MPYRTSKNMGGTSAYMLVNNSGMSGQIIFRGDVDYERFILILKRLIRTNETVSLLGYSLLQDSFYLLLLERQRGSVSKLLHRLTITYGIYFNSKYLRTGKVFRGPYKDILINTDDQLMQTLCKLHRLPELLTEDLETYKWSSYHYYLSPHGTWLDKTFATKYFATSAYQNDLRQMTSRVRLAQF